MSPSFADRLAEVGERMAVAAARSGRSPSSVRLVAVSKFHPANAVREAFGCGQTLFGENYVQEAAAKQEALADCPGIGWHFIGHLQTNKAKAVAGRFDLVHTVDGLEVAEALSRRMPEDLTQDILLQVNLGDEAQKSGVPFDGVARLAEALMDVPRIRVKGLMGMPPAHDAGDAARPFFARLRECRDGLERRLGIGLPELSMGMSGDFEQAVLEGATIVRVGTMLFGPRPGKG